MDAQEALSAKLSAISSDLQNATGEAVRQINNAAAANRTYPNSSRIDQTWKVIEANGIEAAFKMIDECLSVGMRDAEKIDAAVLPEYECFLRSWNEGAGSPPLEQREQALHTQARTFVSRIQTEVRTRVFEARKQDDAKKPKRLERIKTWLITLVAIGGAIGTISGWVAPVRDALASAWQWALSFH